MDQALRRLERQQELLGFLAELGPDRTRYVSADLSDPDGPATLIRDIHKSFGRLDVIIHAAGIQKSRLLEEKPLAELQQTSVHSPGDRLDSHHRARS